jgi:hypothetical protein
MPSLDGAAVWLNPEPLGRAGLLGHVMLANLADEVLTDRCIWAHRPPDRTGLMSGGEAVRHGTRQAARWRQGKAG